MANEAKRFYKGSGIAKHREWRGLKDTFYDYVQWAINLGILAKFITISPVRIVKGLFEYRWFGGYIGALHMIDKCTAGMRGPALRVSHTQMHAIMKGTTGMIGNSMKGDRRFGDTEYANRFVMLEQTMCPEIVAGFPNLKALPLEVLQGLLGTYMDQNLAPFYMDIMESVGLPPERKRRRRCNKRRLPADRRMPCNKQHALRLIHHEQPAHRATHHHSHDRCGHPHALGGSRHRQVCPRADEGGNKVHRGDDRRKVR